MPLDVEREEGRVSLNGDGHARQVNHEENHELIRTKIPYDRENVLIVEPHGTCREISI